MSADNQPASSSSLTDDHPWLQDGFLTITEAAAVLGGDAGKDVIRQWCKDGLLRAVQEPISRRYLVCESDVRSLTKYCDGRVPTRVLLRVWKEREEGER